MHSSAIHFETRGVAQKSHSSPGIWKWNTESVWAALQCEQNIALWAPLQYSLQYL